MEILEKIKSGTDLKFEEATIMFNEMLSGAVDESLIEEILVALAEKGEAEEEIAYTGRTQLRYIIGCSRYRR